MAQNFGWLVLGLVIEPELDSAVLVCSIFMGSRTRIEKTSVHCIAVLLLPIMEQHPATWLSTRTPSAFPVNL